jgi:hypothetical protein
VSNESTKKITLFTSLIPGATFSLTLNSQAMEYVMAAKGRKSSSTVRYDSYVFDLYSIGGISEETRVERVEQPKVTAQLLTTKEAAEQAELSDRVASTRGAEHIRSDQHESSLLQPFRH